MKRCFSLLLVIFVVLVCTGCGGGGVISCYDESTDGDVDAPYVIYDGKIAESYPPQILSVYSICKSE